MNVGNERMGKNHTKNGGKDPAISCCLLKVALLTAHCTLLTLFPYFKFLSHLAAVLHDLHDIHAVVHPRRI
jgi:hypothetical protein